MKKAYLFIICLIVIAIGIFCFNHLSSNEQKTAANVNPSSYWVQQYDKISNDNTADKTKIQALLSIYFEANYEGLKTLQPQNIDFMLTDNQQNKDEKTLRNIHIQKLKNMKDSYASYKISLEYRDIKIENNTAEAYVTVGCDFNYASLPIDPSSMWGDEHIIKLTKADGTWKIASDSHNDPILIYIKHNYKNPEEYLNELKTSKTP